MKNPTAIDCNRPHSTAIVTPGIQNLPLGFLSRFRAIGLVAHPASLTTDGRHSADHLHDLGLPLAALFGPEHGFYGRAAAGAPVSSALHPGLHLPIHSLYGATRAPTQAMLDGLDLIIFDLQSLACRAYTYVSTLRLVMEACAAAHLPLLVADRPDPLMLTPPDGPLLDPAHSSFVALAPLPFHYGLTPAEAALRLKDVLPLPDLDLHIAPCLGLSRAITVNSSETTVKSQPTDPALARLEAIFPPPFPAPSPSIQNLQSALCFPATVFMEALPALSHARPTSYAFQYLSAPDRDLADILPFLPPLPGLCLEPAEDPATRRPGLHLAVTSPRDYHPAASSLALLRALETLYTPDVLWSTPGARPEWPVRLWGAPLSAPFLPPSSFTPTLLY